MLTAVFALRASANQTFCRRCERADFLTIPECRQTGWVLAEAERGTPSPCTPSPAVVLTVESVVLFLILFVGTVVLPVSSYRRRWHLMAHVQP
jgi:hypothetical protein